MTDAAAAATATQSQAGDTSKPTDPPAAEQTTEEKPTETVEFWKAQARENEKRAKANADAAKRLADIEEAQKTEAQKAAERLAAAEKDAADARAEALRLRIATKYGISEDDADTFLTGTDEESLTRQAERLAKLAKTEGNPPPAPRPDLSQGARDTAGPGAGDPASVFADFLTTKLKR